MGRETETGTLDAGMKADLVVLDDDLMIMPEDEIAALRSALTIVDGSVVMRRDDPDRVEDEQ